MVPYVGATLGHLWFVVTGALRRLDSTCGRCRLVVSHSVPMAVAVPLIDARVGMTLCTFCGTNGDCIDWCGQIEAYGVLFSYDNQMVAAAVLTTSNSIQERGRSRASHIEGL